MALQVVDAVQLIASVPRALGMLVGTLRPEKQVSAPPGVTSSALMTYVGLYRAAVATLVGPYNAEDPTWQHADQTCRQIALAWLDVHTPLLGKDDLLVGSDSQSLPWSHAGLAFAVLKNHLALAAEPHHPGAWLGSDMVGRLASAAEKKGSPALLQALGHALDARHPECRPYICMNHNAAHTALYVMTKSGMSDESRSWAYALARHAFRPLVVASGFSCRATLWFNGLVLSAAASHAPAAAGELTTLAPSLLMVGLLVPQHTAARALLASPGTNAAVDALRAHMGDNSASFLACAAVAHFDTLPSAVVRQHVCARNDHRPYYDHLVGLLLALPELDTNHRALLNVRPPNGATLNQTRLKLIKLLATAPSIAAMPYCLAKLPAKKIVRVAKNVAERCRLYMVHVEHSHCRAERLLFWETLACHKGRPPMLKHLERLVRHVRASTGVSGLLARALAPPSQA